MRVGSVAIALMLLSGAALADPPATTPRRTAASARPSASRYRSYVDRWHTLAPDERASLDENGRPELALVSLNTNDRVEVPALSDQGGFAASDLDAVAFVLREPATGNAHPVEPRLVDLVYRVQRQFAAPEIRVVSGYRTPHGRNASNHGRGRAIDLVVPGAADADVAKFARELGFVGVGIYPKSGFVHIDVRDRSYFWVDASLPGRRNRERGILGDLAQKSDAAAAARGELRLPPLAIATDLDAAVKAWRSQPGAAEDEDGDDDDPGTRAPSDG